MKISKLLVLIVMLFAAVQFSYAQKSSSSEAGGMSFQQGTVADVFKAAKEQNKYIFVDCYADWCGPCKWMMANVFPTEEAGKFYNENFIIYKLDMEKGEGVEFAKKYAVQSYPTYLFFSPDGGLVHRSGGSKEVDAFIQDGMNALNPDMTVFGLQKKYESGDRSEETLYNYAMALYSANLKGGKEVAEEYLATQNESDLTSEKNWEFIYKFVNTSKSDAFKYLENNADTYSKLYGEEKVWTKITRTHIFGYMMDKNFKGMVEYTASAEDKLKNNGEMLNTVAWTVYEELDDKESLEKALKWSDWSLKDKRNYYNLDTYAALLYKLGRYDEALKFANEAIEQAKKEDMKYDGTTGLVEMIKAKM